MKLLILLILPVILKKICDHFFRITKNLLARVYNLEMVPVTYENAVAAKAVNTTDTSGNSK